MNTSRPICTDITAADLTEVHLFGRHALFWFGPSGDNLVLTFAGDDVNRQLGNATQLAEKLRRQARRAGHQHRTALRTAQLRRAVEACEREIGVAA